MGKKFKVMFMIFLFLLTNLIYADDNTNAGSVSENFGTIHQDIATLNIWESQSNISIARIGLYNGETKEMIDRFIVSNFPFEDLKDIRLASTMTKTEYIALNGKITNEISDYLENKDEYLYIPSIVHIPDFPQLLIKNEENVYNNIKAYFNDYNKVQNLTNIFNVDYSNGIENLILLIEPMGIFRVTDGIYEDAESARANETLVLLSSAEIGLLSYNEYPIFNYNLYDKNNDTIMPFASYYYTQLYQVIPFSIYKVDIERLRQIKPYISNVYNWNAISKSAFLSMIDSLGCFEVYSNIGGAEIVNKVNH